jgi:uncharacterized protein YjcR
MASKIPLKQRKELAATLYIEGGMTQKEISLYLETPEKTLKSWREKGSWDTLRAAHTITPSKIVAGIYVEIHETLLGAQAENRRLNAKEHDANLKAAKTIDLLSKKVSIASASGVFTAFNLKLKHMAPELLPQITMLQRDFLLSLNAHD